MEAARVVAARYPVLDIAGNLTAMLLCLSFVLPTLRIVLPIGGGRMLNQFAETFLLVVAGLFPVINPPAAGFIVLSLVPQATPAERAYLAKSISINSLVILFLSLSIGAYVLSFFGISLPALRVAGGMVIAFAGWNLLHAPADADREPEQRTASDATREA
jgi:multiple antibiotic resistance protein